MIKRIFLIVIDSVGIGAEPDADQYGDAGSNTLRACFLSGKLNIPNLQSLGLFNIDGVDCGNPVCAPLGAFARLREASVGKDTTIGHWEIAGLISKTAMPTYPHGFPTEIISELVKVTGRGILCNQPASGTEVIRNFGREHEETGKLIVYTSADSVMQIAAHENIVPIDELYRYCEMARKIMHGKHGVGRIIARPFDGKYPNYTRTTRRHDFSLTPPRDTMLDYISAAGLETLGVGKIYDIFAGKGLSNTVHINNNDDGMDKVVERVKQNFHGLCFVNLVDFDMLYGHRNDVDGYTKALNSFDERLGELLPLLCADDILMITADHGCDPLTPSTDHSREYVPLLIYGAQVNAGLNLGTRPSFSEISATVMNLLEVCGSADGINNTPAMALKILKGGM